MVAQVASTGFKHHLTTRKNDIVAGLKATFRRGTVVAKMYESK
jgi:hypothetical protein